MKRFFQLQEFFGYFVRVFRKHDDSKYPNSFNLRMMHGINKISIVMFLICAVVIISRFVARAM
jgi:hypothetical protein